MPPRVTRAKAALNADTNHKPVKTTKKAQIAVKPAGVSVENESRELMMAYLRIRPHPDDQEPSATPYLSQLSEVSVRMTDPTHEVYNSSRFRPSTVPPTSTYTFSHVFPPTTTQSDLFKTTTLPLVHDVLQGQNSLLFAYGATNSGKTFTVQGGSDEISAGIVPRALDVIFNSIDGLHGDGKFRPTRLYGIEPADSSDSAIKISQFNLPIGDPSIAQVLGHDLDQVNAPEGVIDTTILKIGRNHEYTVYISYAEVYNEKVFDLLAPAKGGTGSSTPLSTPSSSLLLTRQALPLKSSPTTDSPGDATYTGKYVAGLSQFRVHTAAQAKAVVKFGQMQRRVFGTLANRESSRSHGIVIIKVMRCHRGEKNNSTAFQVSRFTLVDLAGSERTKHTGTTGERLKEAGNINKSLMVLGQCLQVMRANQRKLCMALGMMDTRVDTRDVKRAFAIVPFRHSKLTELLMDYFVGDGRAVMIVNVNPYDTGYDENSHVMKFAALAREVYITPAPAPVQKIQQKLGRGKAPSQAPATLKGDDIVPRPFGRKVTLSNTKNGKKLSEAVVEVMEVDEEPQDDEDEGLEGTDALIEELFEEVSSLRMQLFEAEMRSAVLEAETRDEVMEEMRQRMRTMEKMYAQRLMDQVEENEKKLDAKIGMLHRAGVLGSNSWDDDSLHEDEESVELSLLQDDGKGEEVPSETSSPEHPQSRNRKSSCTGLRTQAFEIDDIGEEEPMDDTSENESEYTASSDDTEEEWKPSPILTKKTSAKQRTSKGGAKRNATQKNDGSDAKLTQHIARLQVDEQDGLEPKEQGRVDDGMDEDSDILQPKPAVKKRQLNKNKVVMEELMQDSLEGTKGEGRMLRRRVQK